MVPGTYSDFKYSGKGGQRAETLGSLDMTDNALKNVLCFNKAESILAFWLLDKTEMVLKSHTFFPTKPHQTHKKKSMNS